MTAHAQVEAAKTISRQAVATALQDHGLGAVILHDSLDDWLEDSFVGDVVDSVAQREVHGVVLAGTDTNVTQLARAREVFAVLVERNGHDAIGGVESLLNSVTVVDIYVDVENALVETEEFDNCEDDV